MKAASTAFRTAVSSSRRHFLKLTASAAIGGGFMLGFGGSLVPGANDGLILLGLPLLYPHALLALASMVVTVSAALFLERHRSAMAQKTRLA